MSAGFRRADDFSSSASALGSGEEAGGAAAAGAGGLAESPELGLSSTSISSSFSIAVSSLSPSSFSARDDSTPSAATAPVEDPENGKERSIL